MSLRCCCCLSALRCADWKIPAVDAVHAAAAAADVQLLKPSVALVNVAAVVGVAAVVDAAALSPREDLAAAAVLEERHRATATAPWI